MILSRCPGVIDYAIQLVNCLRTSDARKKTNGESAMPLETVASKFMLGCCEAGRYFYDAIQDVSTKSIVSKRADMNASSKHESQTS